MAKSTSPIVEGFEYQALFFWYHAAILLSTNIIKMIEYESDKISFVDDLIVYYEEPGVDAGGWNCMVDFFQVKYHVDNRSSYNSQNIIQPSSKNETKSILQKFYNAYKKIKQKKGKDIRLSLVSNWQWDPQDTLFCGIRESYGALPDSFFSQTKRQKIGKIRESWRLHLDINEEDFVEFAQKLRFDINHFGRTKFKELVMSRLKNAGLTVDEDLQKTVIYSGLASGFIADQIRGFTKESLFEICKSHNLIEDKQDIEKKGSVVGVRSFMRYAERIEDECDSHVCVAKYFSGRNLKHETDWNKNIVSDIKTFFNQPDFVNLVRSKDHSVMLECHSSIAFFVGYMLPVKSGAQMYPIQKGINTVEWRPTGITSKSWGFDIDKTVINKNAKNFVFSISITHDVYNDVDKYMHNTSLNIHSVIRFQNKSGLGHLSVENADHALFLVNEIQKQINNVKKTNNKSVVHLFVAAPNGFMFFLGKLGEALGSIQLYEFDFTCEKDGTYTPSIRLH